MQAADGNADSYSISVGETGVTSVYTIINSAFGIDGATIGSLRFAGSDGATYTYDLTEGDNVRDHATTFYNDVAANLYATKDYGSGDHLDVQKIVLPATFATQTLTSITFDAADAGGGDPFLAAVTTSTVSAVPLPASLPMLATALLAMGALGYGLSARLARQPDQPPRGTSAGLEDMTAGFRYAACAASLPVPLDGLTRCCDRSCQRIARPIGIHDLFRARPRWPR